MTEISAKVIADSISPSGVRLTTMQLRYPRFIHSEFMTHRLFSRNAASSRAIPVQKFIDQVDEDPAMPIHWGKNQPGMQAREELVGYYKDCAIEDWRAASKGSVEIARLMTATGLHKQVVNRILEPYQYISVVVTATEWDNFFNLRLHEGAQPEICELARVMKEAVDLSVPHDLSIQGPLPWHLPYIRMEELERWALGELSEQDLIKCSVARCARVSYLNHDQSNPDVLKDIALHDILLSSQHMSPFEHQATPMDDEESIAGNTNTWPDGATHVDREGNFWSGNLRGWSQYRQLVGDNND